MIRRAVAMDGLRGLCVRLSAEKRALLTRLGSLGLSDQTYIAALVIVQMMRFDRGSLLRVRTVSEISGLPLAAVRQAANDLLELGAMEIQNRCRGRRSANLYRLSGPFLSGRPADGVDERTGSGENDRTGEILWQGS